MGKPCICDTYAAATGALHPDCPVHATKRESVGVFMCTEEDMRAGGFGPLPRDPKAVHHPTDEERVHINAIMDGVRALQRLGWRQVMYAPRNNTPFLIIEPGSTGIHECTRDKEGRFWSYDGDVWPSNPMLFKALATFSEARSGGQ